uniref:BfmA/BtgA family mobilization protein n=1 Tax=Mariniflexile sp. TaxID=1979402 RepID=UPI00404827FF
MDKGYEKEQFKSLSIKASVVDKFNKFCKEMSLSKSMTLLVMIEFFQENCISPTESMGPNMENLEKRISLLIKKRMNGMIAIMKDIEKTQTKPTVAMLQSLFEQAEPPKKKLILAKKIVEEKKEVRFREIKNPKIDK